MNCGERYEETIDHRSYTNIASAKFKSEKTKKSVLNGIRTHDLCETGAVPHQLSDQANWELVTNEFFFFVFSDLNFADAMFV